MAIRWDCPNGEHPGVLGPQRPRKNAIVRYCLPCSEEAGVLVERVAPALERQRAAKTAARKSKAQRQRERKQAKAQEWPNPLHEIFARAKKLKCWRADVRDATLKLSASTKAHSTGHGAYNGVVVTAGREVGDAIETLLHELCHTAHIRRHRPRYNADRRLTQKDYHDDRFHSMLLEAARELLGAEYVKDVVPKRDTKYSLDWALTPVFRRAVADGVFGELPTYVKPKLPKRRKKEPTPLGQVEISIPQSVLHAHEIEYDTWRRPEYTELCEAWDEGNRKKNRLIITGSIDIATQLIDMLNCLEQPTDWQAVDRLENRAREIRLKARGRVAKTLCSLVAAMRMLP